MNITLKALTEKVIKVDSADEVKESHQEIILNLKSIHKDYYWYSGNFDYYSSDSNFKRNYPKGCFIKISLNKRDKTVMVFFNLTTKKEFCTLEELKQSSSQIWEF